MDHQDMTMEDFIGAFNARAEEIGHGIRITGTDGGAEDARSIVLKLAKDGKDAPSLALVVGREGAELHGCIHTVQALCSMDPATSCDGLVVYSTAIDALFRGAEGGSDSDVKWRNDILRRLKLFNGGLATGRLLRTESRSTVFEARVNDPARGLLRMAVRLPRG